jgi:hypothetical protein
MQPENCSCRQAGWLSHLVAPIEQAGAAAAVLDTVVGAGLRGLGAALVLAALAAPVRRAELGPAHRGLGAPLRRAALAPAVRRAEQLVAGALVAPGKGAPAAATVGDAKLGCPLGALAAARGLAASGAPVFDAVQGIGEFHGSRATLYLAASTAPVGTSSTVRMRASFSLLVMIASAS